MLKDNLKKTFLLFLFLFGIKFLVFSQTYTVESVPNVRLKNYLNHVSNPDNIISQQDVETINKLLNHLEDSLQIEVAVVALKNIGDYDAREFATRLFTHWGIGRKGEDNGLLIQLITDPPQRSVVFETGYGIEGILPDAICFRLQQQYMIPYLKQNNYSIGVLHGVNAVTNYLLASDYERPNILGNIKSNKNEGVDFMFIIITSIMFFLVFIINLLKMRPKKCPHCGQKTYSYYTTIQKTQATYSHNGVNEKIYRCKNCGYEYREQVTTSKLNNNSGPFIGGGGFGSSGRGFSGGSWGGGSSGGGGSISRF